MVSHENIIIKIFEKSEFIKYNKWFFEAKWKDVVIENFETENNYLTWKNGTWIDGTWIDGTWIDGTWEDGTWYNGSWKNGIWKSGTWKRGIIWDSTIKKYRFSNLPPNECSWSLSYGKS